MMIQNVSNSNLRATLLSLIELGEHKFGTGGAEVNSASRTTVQKLGFSVDEIWNTYLKPR